MRMARSSPGSQPPKPTQAELEILRVLWQRGAIPVREILDALNEGEAEPRAYTTVLRFLQIMTEKRLVTRAESGRGHIYSAALPAERTQRQMVRDLIDRVFGGSAAALVQQALGARKVSAEELREIRRVLKNLEEK